MPGVKTPGFITGCFWGGTGNFDGVNGLAERQGSALFLCLPGFGAMLPSWFLKSCRDETTAEIALMLAYFERAQNLLSEIARTQSGVIEQAANAVAQSLIAGGIWHVFGTGHSHAIAEELYYRAGGLAPVNAILFPALMQHEGPATSTRLERLPGLAQIILDKQQPQRGDVLLIVSNSGKNAVPVEMALCGRQRGLKTIALTSLAQSRAAQFGAGQAQKLFEVCDIVIDNCGTAGDAALAVPESDVLVSPTSTLANVAIVEQIVHLVCCRYSEHDLPPPVFKTANLPGGDEWNAHLIERYGDRVFLK
jgi:uncharacterized phosphosugar-binding protein